MNAAWIMETFLDILVGSDAKRVIEKDGRLFTGLMR
jgi:hypothetical protein